MLQVSLVSLVAQVKDAVCHHTKAVRKAKLQKKKLGAPLQWLQYLTYVFILNRHGRITRQAPNELQSLFYLPVLK